MQLESLARIDKLVNAEFGLQERYETMGTAAIEEVHTLFFFPWILMVYKKKKKAEKALKFLL